MVAAFLRKSKLSNCFCHRQAWTSRAFTGKNTFRALAGALKENVQRLVTPSHLWFAPIKCDSKSRWVGNFVQSIHAATQWLRATVRVFILCFSLKSSEDFDVSFAVKLQPCSKGRQICGYNETRQSYFKTNS